MPDQITRLLDQIDRLDQEASSALPKLAEAVYHVLDLLDAAERVGKHAYDFGGGKAPSLVSTSEVRKAITDA